MKISKRPCLLFSILLFFLVLNPLSFAADSETTEGQSNVEILSPKPNDILPAGSEVIITYRFLKGLQDKGSHVHVYVDGKNAGTAKRSPRSLGKLPPGKHNVILKVANHEHDAVHVETSVQFEVLDK